MAKFLEEVNVQFRTYDGEIKFQVTKSSQRKAVFGLEVEKMTDLLILLNYTYKCFSSTLFKERHSLNKSKPKLLQNFQNQKNEN